MPNYKGCPFCGDPQNTNMLVIYDGMKWYAHEKCCTNKNVTVIKRW